MLYVEKTYQEMPPSSSMLQCFNDLMLKDGCVWSCIYFIARPAIFYQISDPSVKTPSNY